jgi:two-component system CheB/CheR fusion protein
MKITEAESFAHRAQNQTLRIDSHQGHAGKKPLLSNGSPRRLRVLVADDCPDARASLRMVLILLGHEVTEAGDGASALEAARATRPHVALLDLAMPRGNGLEVARQVRQDPSLHGILLVAVTGYSQEEVVAQALAAGFDRHFLKPVEFTALQALLSDRACCRGE